MTTRGEAGMTRRRFLTGLGVAGSAAVAAGYGLSVWRDGASHTSSPAGPTVPRLRGRDDRTLVVVELAGGNDGFNTVVPFAEPAYRSLRPTLGVADPIALDDTVGFHPELAKLAARYRAGQVAIVEGVGYPDPDLSHFASLAYWWSGAPGVAGTTGWLGRYLDATVGFDDPLAAVGIGPTPSPALLGERSFATTIADANGLQPTVPPWVDDRADLLAAWARFVPAEIDEVATMGQLLRAIRATGRARTELADALGGRSAATGGTATGGAAATAGGTADGYGQEQPATAALALAAGLVLAEHAPRVVYVSGLGDFDTHQGQAARHRALLRDLDAAVDGFLATLEHAGAADRALLMTVSEFGRRPQENGSGTDHGTAAAHFVVGATVRGGRYGAPPTLAALDDHGNVKATTDYRSLYATALQSWLGVDAAAVLGKGFAPLPLLA